MDNLDFFGISKFLDFQKYFTFQISPTEWWNEARPHLTIANVVRFIKFSFLVNFNFVFNITVIRFQLGDL
jgi:hypothetical protein